MHLATYTDPQDGSSCALHYDEANQWIRAAWVGHIDPHEAYNGAAAFLQAMQQLRCPYLLNDNSTLRGPWFDSMEWVRTVWSPQVERLGLRYIAHVVQPHDLLNQAAHSPLYFGELLQLQLFEDVPSAAEWLHGRQAAARRPGSL